ncbi:MAG TPA: hypothetical protein VGS08_05410 [Candidatus Saccharimonadales bacterium]|nr:hypothetical protein [Candidatus Saccharimonadales bacterium]
MQQSTPLLGARGPDGVGKEHPCRDIQRAYRASVLKAGRLGRCYQWDDPDPGDSFASLRLFCDDKAWKKACHTYFHTMDTLPHHYISHLMHGAQILGYKHPDARFRQRWLDFYHQSVLDLHLCPESEADMDVRLGDFGREQWDNPKL